MMLPEHDDGIGFFLGMIFAIGLSWLLWTVILALAAAAWAFL